MMNETITRTQCPRCGRLFGGGSQLCGACNHTLRAREAADEAKDRRTQDLVLGTMCLGLGAAVTFLTYQAASISGGVYVIAIGPMLFGARRLWRAIAAG